MKKRIFIAINLPADTKKYLVRTLDKIKPVVNPEVRFLSSDNWRLTVEFLAYQDDQSVSLISKALEKVAAKFPPPPVEFEKIIYGPPGKPPRMIWLTCGKETSLALGKIKDFLEKELSDLGVRFHQEHRQFNAHLTLARFATPQSEASLAPKGREVKGKEELPKLDIAFNGNFSAGGEPAFGWEAPSIDLMESHLKRSGAEYGLLSRFEFSG